MIRRHLFAGLLVIAAGGLVSGQGPTDAETRRRAWARHQEMERASPFKGLAWRAVGPRLQGGRIEAIAVAPGKPGTMYVGPGSGNVWKTTNDGLSWTPIFEKQSTFSIGDIALAPSDPEVVWVGTGETQPRHSGYSFAGTGVFKSTDAGGTWQHMGLWDTHHIGKVVIHPRDKDVVYVAAIGHFWSKNAERGVFKTTDGGRTWKKVLFISDRTGVVDLLMDPSRPETLYAWAWQVTHGKESGLYKTTNGGQSWRRITQGLPTGPMGRAGLDVFARDPRVLYAFVDDHSPFTGENPRGRRRAIEGAAVYRSDDRGESWRKVNKDDLYSVFSIYGWKFCDVRISPADPNEIFILGNRAYHSRDGGKSFVRIGEKILRLHDTEGKVMHLDHHELWIDPADPNHLVLGNDGGLFVSRDRGRSWLHVNNLPIGEFYFVGVDETVPYTIFGGTQDNAALFGPPAPTEAFANDPWRHVFLDVWTGGDAFVTLRDPTNPDIVYYEHQHGAMRRMDVSAGQVQTGGPATKGIRPRAPRGTPRWRFGWYTPFIISHHDPKTLYVGGNVVAKSTDRGDHWKAISDDLADPASEQWAPVPFGTITMISESRFHRGSLYVGTEGGRLYMTRSDGENWVRIDTGTPRKWVSRVVASRHEEPRVYASFTGFREDDFSAYLFVSEDFGHCWRSISAGLAGGSINVVREDPLDPDTLYVGTDLGVFVSLDRGARWHSLTATLPTTPVHDLVVHPKTRDVVIGTHGRSVFVLEQGPIEAVRQSRR